MSKLDINKIILDFDNLKDQVDLECNKVGDIIKKGTRFFGGDLRNYMMEIISYMSTYSELYDEFTLLSGIQEERISRIESVVMQKLIEDDEYKKIPATLKKYYLDTLEIEMDGIKTSYNDEQIRLQWYKYAIRRFYSCFERLKLAVNTYQSALNFDKEELKKIMG